MRLSKAISIILHPVFIPLITLKTTLFFAPSIGFAIYSYLNFMILTVVLTTIVFPLLLILFLVKKGKVASLEMANYKERPKPLIYSALTMFIGYSVLESILTLAPVLKAELLAAIIIVGLASFISKYWKISLHMLGVGGGTGALIGIHFLYGGLSQLIILAILISGILGIARINEKAHNYAQIYVGFLVGLFIQLSAVLLL
jgi:hypothetical protein